MSRKTIITKVQRTSDTRKTSINAAEVSRVAMLILDEIQAKVEAITNMAESLLYDISRARRKHGSKRRGK